MYFTFNFIYKKGSEKKETHEPDNSDFTVSITEEANVIKFLLTPRAEISFEKFEIVTDCDYKATDKIFTNGYQSWTATREYTPKDNMKNDFEPRFLGIHKKHFNPLGIWGAGDLTFHTYPEESGIFYGYSYGYIRRENDITLYGSLSERAGYTIITFNTREGIVSFEKDFEGVTFEEEREVLSLAILKGDYNNCFDKYFELMQIPEPKVKRSCGYTTWYNYYTGITEEIVRRDLKAISKLGTKIDIFQIDDGYQRTVGDWLIPIEEKFPTGMREIADEIHKHNMLAGLWLAPFSATPKSYIFKEHKDWFVRDKKGKMHFASQNWGGFYALDIYNEGARAYIRDVFDTVLNVWGYDMVKLDFLYVCCIIPIHGKSRGEIMCDAMDFLRECCGDKIILGCGVPLAPAFGKVDFCRIGADMSLDWDNKPFSREDVSTQNTLTNTVFRRHLDGRAFLNDPDVFLLRDDNINMTPQQRQLVADVNSICGNLLFVSDDVSTYDEWQKQAFLDTVTRPKAEILSADICKNDELTIDYALDGKENNITFNIKTGARK